MAHKIEPSNFDSDKRIVQLKHDIYGLMIVIKNFEPSKSLRVYVKEKGWEWKRMHN